MRQWIKSVFHVRIIGKKASSVCFTMIKLLFLQTTSFEQLFKKPLTCSQKDLYLWSDTKTWRRSRMKNTEVTLWWKYNINKDNWIIHRGIRFMFTEQNLTSTCFPMLLFPVMNSTEHPDLNWCTSRQRGRCPTTILLTTKPSTGSGPFPAPR